MEALKCLSKNVGFTVIDRYDHDLGLLVELSSEKHKEELKRIKVQKLLNESAHFMKSSMWSLLGGAITIVLGLLSATTAIYAPYFAVFVTSMMFGALLALLASSVLLFTLSGRKFYYACKEIKKLKF